jgi:5-methyltetrahydropteroyltriglutamate--homocysteine methyltransferase
MKRTKAPFRADHVGSLLRPASLKQAREKRAKGEISAADLKAVEDREIERVIKKQEEVGLQAVTDGEFRRSWWHLDFLWGLDGAERHSMDTGIAFAAVTTRNEGVRGDRQARVFRPSDDRAFQVRRGAHQRMPKMTIPAPSAIYGRPVDDADRQDVYPEREQFFRRSRPGLSQGGARLRRRRAAATSSSTRYSSPCCAIRNIGHR